MLLNILKAQLRFSSTRPKLIAPSVVETIPQIARVPDHTPEKANLRKLLPHRCGAIIQKLGMISHYCLDTGDRFAATVLQLDNVEVIGHRTVAEHGYSAYQVGYGNKKPSLVTRQQLGHFASKGVNPKAKVAEIRVKNETNMLPIRTLIKPSFFKVGQFIDLRAVSKGKGFAGVMKRHGFKGLKATHGVSRAHRKGGSYGQNQTPGRILPGKKMPGHMGVQQVTVQNLKVLKVDDENGVIVVKGCVPGPKGSYAKIFDARKKDPVTD
ncbi:HBL253Wp [Eremothecium sinecaudum]|uniref:Large ribosomal subunit protein uL3m n=1 Tax=Eremothecium sinecaudum TaxID=45286 RepID=A0A120K0S7_9SACH|nr:HBL253Wp [Eremothecium sinecaudum]AMD18649.1 HBL253Wp [Eremothecium sinecaudum]